jgi:hypothetical protein
METLSFILGAGMVVGLLTGIFAVRIYREVQTLKEQNQSLFGEVNDLARTMWEETSRIEREASERISLENQGMCNSIDDIYRQLDSRFDKFENRISEKQVLND